MLSELRRAPILLEFQELEQGASMIRDGDRIREIETGRTGTAAIGWLTGCLSVVWDDRPGENEHHLERAIEKI